MFCCRWRNSQQLVVEAVSVAMAEKCGFVAFIVATFYRLNLVVLALLKAKVSKLSLIVVAVFVVDFWNVFSILYSPINSCFFMSSICIQFNSIEFNPPKSSTHWMQNIFHNTMAIVCGFLSSSRNRGAEEENTNKIAFFDHNRLTRCWMCFRAFICLSVPLFYPFDCLSSGVSGNFFFCCCCCCFGGPKCCHVLCCVVLCCVVLCCSEQQSFGDKRICFSLILAANGHNGMLLSSCLKV